MSSPESEDEFDRSEQIAEESDREPLVAENSPTGTHDPATQAMIEAELKDLPANERAEWISYLNSVEANMVPYILKSRRLAEEETLDESPREKLVAETDAQASPQRALDEQEIRRVAAEQADDSKISETIPEMPTQRDLLASPVAEGTGLAEDAGADEVGRQSPQPQANQSWPNRIKSLADPKRIWPGQEASTKEMFTSDPRNLLPRILGGNDKSNAAGSEKKPSTQAVVVSDELKFNADTEEPTPEKSTVPKSADTLRIPRGSELWEDELDKLVSLLETETSATAHSIAVRADVRKQVALRMLYLIADQPQLAQQAIPGISVAEQEYWTALFQGMSVYLDAQSPAGPAERATTTIAQLRTAAHHLQEISHLQLRNVTFCQKINSFGDYEQFEVDEFAIGQPVLVYTEVRNFRSEPTVDGFYRTKLKSTVEIFQSGADGKMVDRTVFAPTEDLCRTVRSDYFHSYRIDLPSHLTPGPYVLKLSVQDELSGKHSTESVSFTVY